MTKISHISCEGYDKGFYGNEKFVRTPQRFSELVYSREGLTIDRSNFTDKIKIMFEEDRFIIVDNRIFFVYSFPPFDDPYSLLNWCEKEELGFSFLRLCLSHEQLCINPENLEQIPFLMMSKLPQFEFEKNNAEIDELEDDQPAILTAAQIRPFEINRNDTSIGSFNEEFKLDPEVLLSNFIKFSVSLKWTNNHPK